MTLTTTVESRRDLVRGLSSHLGIDAVYAGPPSFAYRIGDYTILRDGSIEADEYDLNAIRQFLRVQGWLDGGRDTTADQEVEESGAVNLEAAPEADADPEAENEGFMEISTPAKLTVPQLINLANMVHSKQYLLNRSFGKECLSIPKLLPDRLTEYTPESPEAFTELLDDVRAVEGMAGFDYRNGTVTMRFPFNESDSLEWVTYADLMHRMIEAAREAHRVRPAIQKPENEKFYFRAWLLRLGYGGTDMKTPRRLLMRNLNGYAAFPNDLKANEHKEKYAAIRRERRAEMEAASHDE